MASFETARTDLLVALNRRDAGSPILRRWLMKVGLRYAVTSLLLVAFAVGCTCMQKSWGTGALAGAGVGAIAGGIATGAASNNSGAFNVGNDNEDKAVAIASGAVSGALIGALVGHCLWDREVVVAQDRKSTRLNSSHVEISYA